MNALLSKARNLYCRAFSVCRTRHSNRHPHGHPSLAELWRWNRERRRLGLPKPPTADLTPATADLERIRRNRTEDLVTWIGHATLLLQICGLNILTDPHFSEYASPIPGFGPRRWQAPGIALNDLPVIDLVLISHNHYDHLDLASVRSLAQTFPQVHFVVPRGIGRWFAAHVPQARVSELDWDGCFRKDQLEIFLVAVQHWSKRTLTDTNTSLWGGFALLAANTRFLFAGDLGYSQACKDIGDQYGPFDLAAIPIGAYEPRWFMHNQHINPAEAVQVHKDVRARRSLGIHWGTFHGITDEPLDQPPHDLALARRQAGMADAEFIVIRHGESIPLHGS